MSDGNIQYIIYKIINKINNKIYIGQTKMTIAQRLYSHFYAAHHKNDAAYDMIIMKAIRKYGKENFVIEQIEIVFGVDNANIAESKWIKELKSQDRNIGYNLSDGGSNYTRTPETREKLRQANLGKPSPMAGKKHTEETKHKISEILTGKYLGENNPNFGKQCSIERRLALSKGRSKTSIYFGVALRPSSGLWRSHVTYHLNGKNIQKYIGDFELEIDAAKARDYFILSNNIECPTNFSIYEIDVEKVKKYFEQQEIKRNKVYIKKEKLTPEQLRESYKIMVVKQKQINKTTSQYIGVCWDAQAKRWRSYIRFNKKIKYFGSFFSELEAAQAREKYIVENNIPAVLNFANIVA